MCCKERSQVQRINIYTPAWLTLPTPMTAQNLRKWKVAPVWRLLPQRLLQCQPVAAVVAAVAAAVAAAVVAAVVAAAAAPLL